MNEQPSPSSGSDANWKDLWELVALEQTLADIEARTGPALLACGIEPKEGQSEVDALAEEVSALANLIAKDPEHKEKIDVGEMLATPRYGMEERRQSLTLNEPVAAGVEEFRTRLGTAVKSLGSTFRQVVKRIRNLDTRIVASRKESKNPELSATGVTQALEKLRREFDALIQKRMLSGPEEFVGSAHLLLRKMKRDYGKTGVMMTPFLKEQEKIILERAVGHLNGAGVVALMGPTGTGKTVMARKVAEKISETGEYEFVSCHSRMLPDDLISRMTIDKKEGADPKDVIAQVNRVYAELKESKTDQLQGWSDEELKESITNLIIGRESAPTLVGKRVHEAVIRAAEKGIPVVLDEFNYLPQETLASMNALTAAHSG